MSKVPMIAPLENNLNVILSLLIKCLNCQKCLGSLLGVFSKVVCAPGGILLKLTYTFESPRFYTPLEVSEWIATSASVFVGMLK